MTAPVNLNQARKAKAKADARTAAVENRVKFGRTKAEKDRDTMDAARAARLIDGARRDES